MALSLFKKSPTVTPTALDALNAWRQRLANHQQTAHVISKRLADQHKVITDAEARAARALAIRETNDLLRANASFDGRHIDLKPMEREQQGADRQSAEAADAARSARIVLKKLESDMHAISQAVAALNADYPAIEHAALEEQLLAAAPDFLAAVDALRDAARKVFAIVSALDDKARDEQTGIFFGGALYNDLQLPKPAHPSYWPSLPTPEEAQRQRIADAIAVIKAGEALRHSLRAGTYVP